MIIPCGIETILLVDDDHDLREMTQMFLETAGYKVLSAGEGAEALQVAHECADVIDLLFTDVVMPKMSGRQLAELLLPFRPEIKVLYMSGYTDDTMIRHGIKEESASFITKPFTHFALTQKVREVLDRTHGTRDVTAAGIRMAAPAPVCAS